VYSSVILTYFTSNSRKKTIIKFCSLQKSSLGGVRKKPRWTGGRSFSTLISQVSIL